MIDKDPSLPAAVPGGNGGSPFSPVGSRHFRRECRDIVQILTFPRQDGSQIIQDHEIVALIRGAVPLAAQAARDGKARDYRAVMQVLASLANLEQSDKPQQHDHQHVHVEMDMGSLIERLENEVQLEARTVEHRESSNGDGKAGSNGDQ